MRRDASQPATAPSSGGARGFLDGGGGDAPALAAALMVGALALLGLQDGLVKLASDAVSLWQFQMLRSALNIALLFLLSGALYGARRPRAKRLWTVALRSTFLVCTMVLFFGGVPYLSLAEIAAGLYVFPLFIAMLSALVLGERVGPRRLLAIAAGFTGALLILKPAAADFHLVSLMPVAAALCYAATVLTTRRLCREESPIVLAFGTGVAFLAAGVAGVAIFAVIDTPLGERWPYLFTGWRPLEPGILWLIAASSCLNLAANISLAKAYQSAESSWLAPFDYSYLIFSTFWGWVFWRDLPDGLSFLGMGLIALAGGYVAWRERREKRLERANFNRNLR